MKQRILTKLTLLALLPFGLYALEGTIDMHGGKEDKRSIASAAKKERIYHAKILSITPVMGYQYLKVDENGTQRWIAIASAPVKVGDTIGYDKRTIMHDFKSKTLGKTFKEIIFANDLYLPQKATVQGSLKSMLGLDKKITQDQSATPVSSSARTKDEKPQKPFVKKDLYTVEEVHMWRKDLKDKTVKVKAKVYKVSRNIMKRDWVHLGDGTGSEKELTDDLVFTAPNAHLKAGDEVIASGKVTVDKDFGYGYFYPVIIEDATFKAVN